MIKAAAYCRVSTDRDDQANSFESQQRYFKEYIDRQPDWELYEVYADEGITGTSTKKRAAFNRMIADAQVSDHPHQGGQPLLPEHPGHHYLHPGAAGAECGGGVRQRRHQHPGAGR